VSASGSLAPGPSLLAKALRPGESIVWSGRPRAGLATGDGEAAILAAIYVFSALGTTSVLLGWESELGVAPAGLAACVLGLALAYSRATTSGGWLTLGLVLQAFMLTLALAMGGVAALGALISPIATLAFLAGWAAKNGLRSRALRYHVSSERGFIESPGLYVISFEFEGPPEVVASRLAQGALGTVKFLAAHGRLLTRTGAVVPVSAPACRFVRVEEPERLVRAWEASLT
jgi:hypothetical protein